MQADPKCPLNDRPARLGYHQRPSPARNSLHPALRERMGSQCRADGPGEMRAPFAPIQTGTAETALAARQGNAVFTEKGGAGFRYRGAVAIDPYVAFPRQRIGQRHAEASGQMVVTGAGITQRRATAPRLRWFGETRHEILLHPHISQRERVVGELLQVDCGARRPHHCLLVQRHVCYVLMDDLVR